MQLQPVIQRELTVVSRRVETWRLRLAFGIGAVAAFAFALMLPGIQPRNRGQVVLLGLAVCGFALSLFTGAYLTADSVSSEKREGTLGLLFLTPLRSWQIVIGKMVTHSLQVSYALVGVIPMFFLPVMLGGVLWTEAARVTLVLLLTLLLSLACGIFWSTLRTEARSTVLLTAVTMLLLTFLPWLAVFLERLIMNRGFTLAGLPQVSPMTALVCAFETNFRMRGAGLPGVTSGEFIYWGSVGVSLICSVGLLGISAWLLPRAWRRDELGERPSGSSQTVAVRPAGLRLPPWAPSRGQAPLVWLAARELREPAWLRFLRMAVALFFGCMLFISVTTTHWQEGYTAAFLTAYGWHLLTRIQLILSSTRRLHEERRNGALEALLAAPLSDAEFSAAHHESLKAAFRRPLIFLLGLNAALQMAILLCPEQLHMKGGAGSIFSVFWIGGALITLADFAALRWLGLCQALRSATQMKAVGRTFGWLFGGAWLAFGVTFLVTVNFKSERDAAGVFGLWVVACLLYDLALVQRCRLWLQPGFRRRATEGPVTLSAAPLRHTAR